jgi:hypothetical protein
MSPSRRINTGMYQGPASFWIGSSGEPGEPVLRNQKLVFQ